MSEPMLTDPIWELIKPILGPPPARPLGGRPATDDRTALNGILYVLRTGLRWQGLPVKLGFGSGMTCWRRLHAWRRTGVWERIEKILVEHLPDSEGYDWSRAHVSARNPSENA